MNDKIEEHKEGFPKQYLRVPSIYIEKKGVSDKVRDVCVDLDDR